jgi:hypothetical protein
VSASVALSGMLTLTDELEHSMHFLEVSLQSVETWVPRAAGSPLEEGGLSASSRSSATFRGGPSALSIPGPDPAASPGAVQFTSPFPQISARQLGFVYFHQLD